MAKLLNFKLFGITYLVGNIKFKLLFQGPLAKWEKTSSSQPTNQQWPVHPGYLLSIGDEILPNYIPGFNFLAGP